MMAEERRARIGRDAAFLAGALSLAVAWACGGRPLQFEPDAGGEALIVPPAPTADAGGPPVIQDAGADNGVAPSRDADAGPAAVDAGRIVKVSCDLLPAGIFVDGQGLCMAVSDGAGVRACISPPATAQGLWAGVLCAPRATFQGFASICSDTLCCRAVPVDAFSDPGRFCSVVGGIG